MQSLYLSLFLLLTYVHDIQVAHFKIHEENNRILVEFVLEREDVLSTFQANNIPFTDKKFKDYLHSNFSVSINSIHQEIAYGDILVKNKHIHLNGYLPAFDENIHVLEIANTCLLNIEDHSNIIEIKLHDQQRDFLMNSDRTSIRITY